MVEAANSGIIAPSEPGTAAQSPQYRDRPLRLNLCQRCWLCILSRNSGVCHSPAGRKSRRQESGQFSSATRSDRMNSGLHQLPGDSPMRTMLLIGCVLAGAATAMAEPPVKVASIEGVTEYDLANGAAGAPLSRSLAADHHRQHDGARWQPPGRLRRNGHGAPPRAHALQGNAPPSTNPQGPARTRGKLQRHHQ